MILVTGATGTIGRHVVRQLRTANADFRIIARSPEKAASTLGEDIQVVQGDLTDDAALTKAMDGVDRLFLLTPSGHQQPDMETRIADVAKRAGVSHIVRVSVLGASPLSPIRINQWHWYCEKYIEKVDIPLTSLRPTFFMQNTLRFAPAIASKGRFYAPADQARISMVDARDIACVAVTSLTQPGHVHRVYDITGPEAITHEDIAQNIAEATGRSVEYVPVTSEVAREAMAASGTPDWMIDDLLTYYDYFRAGHGEVVTPVVERVKGCSAIMFSQFAQDYSAAFTDGTGE